MYPSELALFVAVAALVAVLLAIAVIRFMISYDKDLRYVKAQLARAADWRSMVYWKRELSALRWSIIPGITPERVHGLRRFLYRGRHAQRKDADDGLGTMLLPSLLGICICMACLAGGTFAWFTATQTIPTQTITAAHFSVQATVTKDGEPARLDGKAYVLTPGVWTITLTPGGSASKGYCILDFAPVAAAAGRPPKYVGPLINGETYTFTVTVEQDSQKMLITPSWGSHEQATIPTAPPEPSAPAEEIPE